MQSPSTIFAVLALVTACTPTSWSQVDILSNSASVNLDGENLQGTGIYQDLSNNGLPENNVLYLFAEQEDVTLGSDLIVGGIIDGNSYDRNNRPTNTTIASGTTVSSILLHFNRNSGSGTLSGQFELNREIIGISWASGTGNASLVQSDFLGKTGTIFQSNGGNARGVFENVDTITVNGSTVDFTLRMSSSFIDQFRLILNATPFVYWDLNGATAGSGSSTPNGTWNSSNTFWTEAADGDISTSVFAPNNIAVFSAGTDATGTYTIEKDGTESINGLYFQEGNASLLDDSAAKGSLNLNTTNGVIPSIQVGDGLTGTIGVELVDGGDGLRKTGAGTLVFTTARTRANTAITGTTTIESGTLQLDDANNNDYIEGNIDIESGSLLRLTADDQIGDSSNMTLNGGTFEIEDASDTLGTLTLSSNSTINLSGGNAVVNFDDTSAESWTGSNYLFVNNWDGLEAGGGNEQIFFGTSAAGLSTSQLAQIVFVNPAGFAAGNYSARILANGEIVPVPETSTWVGGFLSVLGIACHIRSRHRKQKK